MNWLLAALLGAIQGITEFLPISSTGHILFFEKLFSFTPCSGNTFEAVIQLGSGCALLFFYWQKLLEHTIKQNALIIFATIPAAIIGLLFHTIIKTHLASHVIMATTLILGGIFFLYIERQKCTPICSTTKHIRFQQAGTVGAAQALALIPGVSRSGATISTGLYLGLNRSTAVEFSFFLALPILFSAGFYELLTHVSTLTPNEWAHLTIGFFSSFFVSLIIIKPLLYTITRFGLMPFGWYRIIFGLLLLGWRL